MKASDYVPGSSITAFPASCLEKPTCKPMGAGVVSCWTEAAYSSSLTEEHHKHTTNRTVVQILLAPT